MTKKEIIKFIEQWAPRDAAWAKDNPGLQIGSAADEVENIFLCLELTEEALNEAIKKKSNFIFTHHPLIFQPIKRLDTQNDKTSKLIELLIKNDITLYSAHTNLDFTKEGVSFQLARTLKLNKIRFLELQESNQYKLVVFVPEDNIAQVSEAIFAAGGGIIGEYENCSFSLKGEGTFRGSEKSSPSVGQAENFERVGEVRLEILLDKWKINKVVDSLLKVHPYEEPAFDIYPLANRNVNYGFGAFGELGEEMTTAEFLSHTARSLNAPDVRYTKGSRDRIRKVAVCGGSGTELIQAAIHNGADAFVTADVKYHTFQDAEGKILLVDAGHYETEVPALQEVSKRLKEFVSKHNSANEIIIFSGTTNPVHFFNINRGEEEIAKSIKNSV